MFHNNLSTNAVKPVDISHPTTVVNSTFQITIGQKYVKVKVTLRLTVSQSVCLGV
jgi:hypothetical protein